MRDFSAEQPEAAQIETEAEEAARILEKIV